jgi:hypothetical protein
MKEENARASDAGEAGSKPENGHIGHPGPNAQAKIIKAALAEVERTLDSVSEYEYDGYADHTAELCQRIALTLRRRSCKP